MQLQILCFHCMDMHFFDIHTNQLASLSEKHMHIHECIATCIKIHTQFDMLFSTWIYKTDFIICENVPKEVFHFY